MGTWQSQSTPMRYTITMCALVVLATTTVARAQGSPEERMARARTLFGQGVQAYEADDLRLALDRLLEAQRAWRTPEIAYNIGRIYERMTDAPNATYWFRGYLEHGSPTAEERADVERRIAALLSVDRRQRQQIFALPPTNDELTAAAREFFLQGAAMFARNEYRAAFEAFYAAQTTLCPSAVAACSHELPEIYYNLGVTAERLGDREHLELAMQFYRDYLRTRRNAEDRAEVQRRVRALRAQLTEDE